MDLFPLLEKMKEYNASDLYLTVGLPPSWRGETIITDNIGPLSNENISFMLTQITSEEERDLFKQTKEINLAISDRVGERYRVNCFYQQQKIGMVIRKMRVMMPDIGELHLDDTSFGEAIMLQRGLILVVGPSGSGKSTTIAAMLNHRNNHGSGHIVTVEDPIEYVHEHKKCIFTQREVGIDTLSWSDALKNALRQRPDVIYIGEIRDRDAMENAINFAETGHLCIATLHATSASQAVERVSNFFPASSKQQHLYSLAQVLKYVFAQRLILGKDGNKLPVVEILKNVGNIKQLIIDGKISEINDLMQRQSDYGMITFEKSLLKLLHDERITEDTAVNESDSPDNMRITIMQSRVRRTAYNKAQETGF